MMTAENSVAVHERLIERLWDKRHGAFALATALCEDDVDAAVLLIRPPQGSSATGFAEHAVLAPHLMSAPTCDVLYVALTLNDVLPFNVFVDPTSQEVQAAAEILLKDGDGFLVLIAPTEAPHAHRLSTLPSRVHEGAIELARKVLSARRRSSGFAPTCKAIMQRAAPAGVALEWVKLTCDEAKSPGMAPFDIPVIANESAEPRWLPLDQLPLVADLIQRELANDRELLATLRRGFAARGALGSEDLDRLKEHLQEQVEFNALHRDQIGHWLGADLSDADATLLNHLTSQLTQLDDVLDQALATISKKY